MIAHSRETYQPTSFIRWDRGIVHGSLDLSSFPPAQAKSARAVFHVPSFASTADKAGYSETDTATWCNWTWFDINTCEDHWRSDQWIGSRNDSRWKPWFYMFFTLKFPVSNSGKWRIDGARRWFFPGYQGFSSAFVLPCELLPKERRVMFVHGFSKSSGLVKRC